LRFDGPLFLLIAADNDRGRPRLGIAAGRRVGGAVARNRVKRLLRESFRRNKELVASSVDIVLVAKPDMVSRSQEEVEHEYRQRLLRVAARRSRRHGPGAPASH
jgi:ribonuclease P protein component